MKAAFLLSLAFLHVMYVHAQDPLFVQTHSNAIYLNPALTGCFINPVISVSYRNQWPDASGGFKTFSTSYHQFVNVLHGGAGFYYMHDDAADGMLITDRFNGSYAAHFEVWDNLVVRLGVTGGYVKRQIDWGQLTFGDPLDPRNGNNYSSTGSSPASSKEFFDCGIGTVVYTKNVYVGIAIDHLNKPNQSFFSDTKSELDSKLVLNVGGFIPIGDSSKLISINPDLLFQRQRDYNITIPSVTVRIKYLLLGAGIRAENNTMLLVGFENKFLRVSYSYDRSFSSNLNFDSHEIFLSVKLFKVSPKKRNWKAINMEAF